MYTPLLLAFLYQHEAISARELAHDEKDGIAVRRRKVEDNGRILTSTQLGVFCTFLQLHAVESNLAVTCPLLTGFYPKVNEKAVHNIDACLQDVVPFLEIKRKVDRSEVSVINNFMQMAKSTSAG
ncbi:unnamed protein product [Heligmosomoides polygyrus]|uniref:RYDR_ITPR domain-containing protein n=1 Tax=Heligmosomoides polygyrus TaxID=6339 RepID=A0A183FPX2_HELPZ|nr:unnamed protein product [Heligmosomoides polygyrus]